MGTWGLACVWMRPEGDHHQACGFAEGVGVVINGDDQDLCLKGQVVCAIRKEAETGQRKGPNCSDNKEVLWKISRIHMTLSWTQWGLHEAQLRFSWLPTIPMAQLLPVILSTNCQSSWRFLHPSRGPNPGFSIP